MENIKMRGRVRGLCLAQVLLYSFKPVKGKKEERKRGSKTIEGTRAEEKANSEKHHWIGCL